MYSPTGAPKRQADLVLPRNHADTIVVLVHGEGNRKQMRGWADFYAEQGYPTFAIDVLVREAEHALAGVPEARDRRESSRPVPTRARRRARARP